MEVFRGANCTTFAFWLGSSEETSTKRISRLSLIYEMALEGCSSVMEGLILKGLFLKGIKGDKDDFENENLKKGGKFQEEYDSLGTYMVLIFLFKV